MSGCDCWTPCSFCSRPDLVARAVAARTVGIPGRALRLPDARARVLRAVVTTDRPTVRSVASGARVSYGEAYRHLCILEHQGFVSWLRRADGHRLSGTLRSTVAAHRPLAALARTAAGCNDRLDTTTHHKE